MLAGLTLAIAASVGTAGAETGSIAVENAWTRATPTGAKVAAGYLTIKNNGDQPDRLVSARADFASKTDVANLQRRLSEDRAAIDKLVGGRVNEMVGPAPTIRPCRMISPKRNA
jgi:hypothetical protein